MKRLISISLSLLFLLGLPMIAYAQEVTTCTVTADSIQTKPGQTITVPVRVTDNPGFTNFAVALEYDKDLLTLVSINTANEEEPYLCGTLVSTNTDWKNAEEKSCGYITAASTEPVKENGILFTATFQVSADFTDSTQVTPKVQYIRNNEAVFSVFEEITASVTDSIVNAIVAGDVNCDGIVEYDDVMLAYQASLGEITLTEEQMPMADMNDDNVIDNTDVEMIYQIYTGG